jgi:hypothetical protein
LGRQGFGLEGRYITLAAPGLCAAYFLWELYGRKPRGASILQLFPGMVATGLVLSMGWGWRGLAMDAWFITLAALVLFAFYFSWETWRYGVSVPLFLYLLLAAMLYRNTLSGIESAARIHAGMLTFEGDMRAGLPPLVLADHYSRPPFLLYPDRDSLILWFNMLRSAGVVPFRDMRPDPDYRAVPLTPEMVSRPDDQHFILKEPRFVYAVRVTYRYQLRARTAPFRFTWRKPGPAVEEYSIEYRLLQEERESSLVVWIAAPLAQFAIFPGARPPFELRQIELLVRR